MRYSIEAWIALGSNVGDRAANLSKAVEGLSALPQTACEKVSRWVETPPVEVGGGMFLNGVAGIRTSLSARSLLAALMTLERRLGRFRAVASPRTVDLDLIDYGGCVIQELDLVVPHPRMHERPFVLVPLAEIAPAWVHPVLGLRAADLLARRMDLALSL